MDFGHLFHTSLTRRSILTTLPPAVMVGIAGIAVSKAVAQQPPHLKTRPIPLTVQSSVVEAARVVADDAGVNLQHLLKFQTALEIYFAHLNETGLVQSINSGLGAWVGQTLDSGQASLVAEQVENTLGVPANAAQILEYASVSGQLEELYQSGGAQAVHQFILDTFSQITDTPGTQTIISGKDKYAVCSALAVAGLYGATWGLMGAVGAIAIGTGVGAAVVGVALAVGGIYCI
jgi:hypothetical protein